MKLNLASKEYYVYLPKKIYEALKEAIKQRLDLDLDSVVLIIHNILGLKFRDKNYEDGEEYISLNSKILEKYVRDYPKYLNFLKEEGFIHFEQSYHEGQSRQFKIIDEYLELPKPYAANESTNDSGIIAHKMSNSLKNTNRMKQNTARMVEAKYRNPELAKWLDKDQNKLNINYDAAVTYVNETYNTPKDNNKRLKRLLTVEAINNGDFRYSREGKDNRFHSNFTSMASNIKQFITFDGKPLKEIDIKSAQPVMITVLFEQILEQLEISYNKLPNKADRTADDANMFRRNLSKEVRKILYRITDKEYLNKEVDIKEYIKSITIMFTQYVTALDIAEFETFKNEITQFIRLVRAGEYYEKLGEQLLEGNIIHEVVDINTGEILYQVLRYDKKKKTMSYSKCDTLRNTAKSVMLNVIYMPAHYKQSKAINFFREKNPAVALLLKIFMMDTKNWNDEKHSYFPVLIQHMEAKVVIGHAIKKIAKKHPEMPLITIHDSISTTVDYFNVLEKEFKKHLNEYFGFEVKTGEGLWGTEKKIQKLSA